jgi:hypothetical protein
MIKKKFRRKNSYGGNGERRKVSGKTRRKVEAGAAASNGRNSPPIVPSAGMCKDNCSENKRFTVLINISTTLGCMIDAVS